MVVKFLLDEGTEGRLTTQLEDIGFDVDRVESVEPLGTGSDDATVRAYANRVDRIIFTYDDHTPSCP